MFGQHANASRLAAIAAVFACIGTYADPAQKSPPKDSPAKPETSAAAPAPHRPVKPADRSGQAVSFVGRGGGPVRVIEGDKESTLRNVREIQVISPPGNAPEYVRDEDASPARLRPGLAPRTARTDAGPPPPPPRRKTATAKPSSLIAPKRLAPGDSPPPQN